MSSGSRGPGRFVQTEPEPVTQMTLLLEVTAAPTIEPELPPMTVASLETTRLLACPSEPMVKKFAVSQRDPGPVTQTRLLLENVFEATAADTVATVGPLETTKVLPAP